jgi:MFS family permease
MADQSGSTSEPAAVDVDSARLASASTGRIIAVIVALVLFSEVAPFQLGMVSVIVPKLGPSFPSAGANVTWAVTMLGVAGGATMALVGKLGDLVGKKLMLLVCAFALVIGCLICALTHSWALFLVGRGIAGISWGMTAIEYGVVRDLIPRKWIPITVGILGTGFGIGGVFGPVICGVLTDHYSWRSIFWFLLIYMLVTIPIVMIAVPESPLRVKQRLDILGAVLFGLGVGAVTLYLSEGSSWGWTATGSLGYLIGGLALLVLFVLWELRTKEPMMELHLLRAPKVSILMVAAFLFTGTIAGVNIAVSYMFETPKKATLDGQIISSAAAQYKVAPSLIEKFITFNGDLSYANGFSVLQLALHVTLWSALFGILLGPIGGYLARKVGARLPLRIAAVAMLAACALWIPWHRTWQEQIGIGVLFGLGFGFYYAANPNLLMDAVPAERQGVSAGMLAVFGAIGTSVATALVTSIQAAHPYQLVSHAGKTTVTNIPQVYTDTGYKEIYLLIGVVPAVIALILALLLRHGDKPALGGAVEEAPAEDAAAMADS